MRITFDGYAAYIYLADEIGAGQAAFTYTCDRDIVDGEINLDFNQEGRLLGIEILDAGRLLPPALLEQARS